MKNESYVMSNFGHNWKTHTWDEKGDILQHQREEKRTRRVR